MDRPPFDAEQDRAARLRHELERERVRRRIAKGFAPVGDLPLFDATTRAQGDIFAPRAPLTCEPAPAGAPLTNCPDCGRAKTAAWGWIITPRTGHTRCPDCWELES